MKNLPKIAAINFVMIGIMFPSTSYRTLEESEQYIPKQDTDLENEIFIIRTKEKNPYKIR